ncbi:MAG TPA: glycosyltransferase [Fulvivirga sp.]|nr:glycosyltransferase [Fulvivirga sp.]
MPLAKKNKRILFIVPYPLNSAPGQRFRFEQYLDILKSKQIIYYTDSFLNKRTNEILYSKGNILLKTFGVVRGYILRLATTIRALNYSYIFVFREASPIGPPVLEWILAKLFHKKIIYDFDDAIWLEDPDEMGSLKSTLKWKSKVASICKWSYKVSVGNQYLADFANQYNDNVVINPTTIDTEELHNPLSLNKGMPEQVRQEHLPASKAEVRLEGEKIVIGWTGTHSTLQYLNPIIPIIQQLEERYDFEFLVIANKNPEFKLKSFRFQTWSKPSEIADLMKIDIGLMPLTDDPWSKGKCGFKLLQYMALEKPVLASPVGINTNIVSHGINGFLCNNQKEWYDHLVQLITDPQLRRKFGNCGRTKVTKDYSVLSNKVNFLSLFE